MDIKKIGHLIAEQRKRLGYTQDDLGKMLNVSGKAVSKWERGLSCPDVSLMKGIAVALKVSIAQLLDGAVTDVAQSSNAIHGSEPVSVFDFEGGQAVDLTGQADLGAVSPYLFGNNLEHTRSCVCGGLSAQMLKNRKFVGKPTTGTGISVGWYVIGENTFCAFSEPYTHHDSEHYHMHRKLECHAQMFSNFVSDEESGMGQHEISFLEGEPYAFAAVVRCSEDMALTVRLTDRGGKHTYADAVLSLKKSEEWVRYEAVLTPTVTDADGDLRITFENRGCVHIGSLSLMSQNNFRGMRTDVIGAMKEMGIQVLRWPGGNFAGEYNWFDGLLPVDERAPFESCMGLETQPHTLGFDFHEINIDDFIALCREIGAEPFITVNLAWNTPEENAAFVEYCNGDGNTVYGRLRSERGFSEPYHVMLWSLGNEFGYGHMEGDNSANGYSHLARETGEKMLAVCPNLTFCSAGPYPSKEWVEYSAKPLSDISQMVSLHYYSPCPTYEDPKRLKEEYQTCLSKIESVRAKVHQLREQLGDMGMISFDEWNVWYGWYRPSCVTDGIYSAMMMHMLMGEAQKSGIGLACHFEAVNESAIRVMPHSVSLTATGQALALMKVHVNGALRYASDCVTVSEKEGTTSATVVNPSYDQPRRFSFRCGAAEVRGRLYEGLSLFPHSRFEEKALDVKLTADGFEVELPPHSLALIQY